MTPEQANRLWNDFTFLWKKMQALENNRKKVGKINGTVSRPDQPKVPKQ
jgi:hypothetical protein